MQTLHHIRTTHTSARPLTDGRVESIKVHPKSTEERTKLWGPGIYPFVAPALLPCYLGALHTMFYGGP